MATKEGKEKGTKGEAKGSKNSAHKQLEKSKEAETKNKAKVGVELEDDEENEEEEEEEQEVKPKAGKKAGTGKKKEEGKSEMALMLEMFREMKAENKELRDMIINQKPHPAKPGEINPIEDFMEEEKTFFAYKYRMTLFGDIRMGRSVVPPTDTGSVFFERLWRFVRKGSNGKQNTVSISHVKVQSKALYKWLKEHTLFGIMFFEDIEDTMLVDNSFQDKIIAASNMVSRYGQMQIIQQCENYKIPQSSDVDKMKKKLIHAIAKSMQTHETTLNTERRKKLLASHKVHDPKIGTVEVHTVKKAGEIEKVNHGAKYVE